MAIYHVHTKIISKSKGQSVVAAAAYRSGSKLVEKIIDRMTGVTTEKVWDYSKKKGVVFSHIFLPEEWKGKLVNYDREKLWNDVTHKELRKDNQLSRDWDTALPIELTKEQNIDLLTEIVTECFVKYGMIADCNMHLDNENNPHLHVMLTMRELVEKDGQGVDFGLKNRTWNSRLYLMHVREQVAVIMNKHLELHGHLSRVSHLSHKARGIELIPTVHEGPAAYINFSELKELNKQIIAENAAAIKENPELVFQKLSINKPVFTKEEIAQVLSDALYTGIEFDKEGKKEEVANESGEMQENSNATDSVVAKADLFSTEELNHVFASEFMVAYQKLMNSDKISLINANDLRGSPLYALTKRVELEKRYLSSVQEFAAANRHNLGIDAADLDPNIFKKLMVGIKDFAHEVQGEVNEKFNLKLDLVTKEHSLTGQQRQAVLEIANSNDLTTLEGWPGSGKTNMMKELVRQYKKAGYTVIGAAPSSAAALVLAKATGIEARNTAMWRKIWQKGRGENFELPLRSDYYKEEQYSQVGQASNTLLTNKHVLIIDEASMVELADMDYLISEIRGAGGKCITVGDNNQFQAVGMGGGLKKNAEIIGASRLTEIMRHKHPDEWVMQMQRLATQLVGEYKIHEALAIYKELDVFRICQDEQETKRELVSNYIDAYLKLSSSLERDDLSSIRSLVVGTYTNESVNYFNQQIREQLKQAGVLKGVGLKFRSGVNEAVELMVGEQIVFESNKSAFKDFPGVLNGEVTTVLSIKQVDEFGQGEFTALLHKADGSKQKIVINTKDQLYPVKFKHGYAVTGYKLQGETADQMLVYFEKVFGYEAFNVLMSRHKYGVILYAAQDLLENIVYERMGTEVEETRKKFEIEAYKHGSSNGTLDPDGNPVREVVPGWYVGLALAISKRVDNNFALDYRANQVLSGNELVIKNYLETRKLCFELQSQMQEWAKGQAKPLPLALLHKQLSEKFDIKYVRQIHIDANGLMYAYNQVQSISSSKVEKLEKELRELQKSLEEGSIDKVSYDKAASKAKGQIEFFSDLNKVTEYFATKVAEGQSTKDRLTLGKEIEATLDKSEYQDNKYQQEVVGSLAASNLAAGNITSDSEANKAKVNWRDLTQKDKNMVILANLPIERIEELKGIFDKLQETREERTKYAKLICDNYNGVVPKSIEDKLRQKETAQVTEKENEQSKDLASEGVQDFKYDSKISMGSKLLQLNLNYETIKKHADYVPYKYFLKPIDDPRTIIENPNFGEILEICYATRSFVDKKSANQVVDQLEVSSTVKQVSKVIASLQEDIAGTEAAIIAKNQKLDETKLMARSLQQEIEDIKQFREKLFPAFLSKIYETPTEEVLDNWQNVIGKTLGKNYSQASNLDDALSVVKHNPQVLGKLKGIGIGTVFGISGKRREAMMNIEALTTRLRNYQNLAQNQDELKKKLVAGDYENLQTRLLTEIKQLNSLLPNEHEQQFIESLVNLHQEGELDSKSLALLSRSEDFKGLLYEYYNYKEEVEKMKEISKFASNGVNSSKGMERTRRARVTGIQDEIVDTSQVKLKSSILTFREVNSQLTEKEYREIFLQYVGLIHNRPKDVIEVGNKLKSGSIQMDLTNGKWTRFSRQGENGRFLSGDIFAFVGLATGKEAAEQLEIVANIVGANGTNNTDSTLPDNILGEEGAISDSTKVTTTTFTAVKLASQWIAYSVVPKHARAFAPKKDLKYLFKDKELEGIFTYRNEAGELIGYTIRPVDKQTGKKLGVLPVTYCHNGMLGAEKKEGWYQKGFTDENGYKPIYGAEKLGQSQNGKFLHNQAPVLIVEGEKTADAAQKLLPDYVVISWMGGSASAGKVDWRVLAGRNVVIWPDNDVPGFSASRVIADKLQKIANSCMVVDPRIFDLPEKWDLADPIPEEVNIRSALVNPHDKESIEIIDKQIGAFNHHHLDNKQMIEMLEKEVIAFLVTSNKAKNNLYRGRLVEELAVISKTGFAEDFLIAGNISKYCKHMNIATGPGRGSAVSSLVAYGLGIHKVDPIEHNLLFERFLTEDTSKNPDFDFDIAASKRILVENYLCAKYSNATKLSVISENDNKPNAPNILSTKEQKATEDIQDIEVAVESVRRTIHPSGIGIVPDKVKTELSSTLLSGKFWHERNLLTIDHKAAEKLGVKKFDLLSSQVIESIDKVEKLVEKQTGKKIDWQATGWNDRAAFQLIKSGDTDGIYQLSRDFAKDVCTKVKMNEFNDIVNLLALIRPGAKNYIRYFAEESENSNNINNGNNSNKQFSDPKGIFKETMGVPLFQEQIMKAANCYLGIPSKETNDFRRELEKGNSSKHPLTSKEAQIKASMEHGLNVNDANSFYHLLKEFSKFGYNKSHAVAYAEVTFKTAYLKAHHSELFNEVFKVNSKERNYGIEKSNEHAREQQGGSKDIDNTKSYVAKENEQIVLAANNDVLNNYMKTHHRTFEKAKIHSGSIAELFDIVKKEQASLSELIQDMRNQSNEYKLTDKAKIVISAARSARNKPISFEEVRAKAEGYLDKGIMHKAEVSYLFKYELDMNKMCQAMDIAFEDHHIRSNLQVFREEKLNVKNYGDLLKILKTEQEFLIGLDGNIKHSIIDGKTSRLIASAKESQKEQLLEKLETLIEYSIKNELKTNVSILRDLELTTDLKATYIGLDKLCENHHVGTSLGLFRNEKEQAKSLDELFSAIQKEQSFLNDLDKKNNYSKSDSNLLSLMNKARSAEEGNILPKLQELTKNVIEIGVKDKESLCDELQKSTDLTSTYTSLDKAFEHHHIASNLSEFRAEKGQARTTEGVIKAITKEQEFLGSLYGNLKYPESYSDKQLEVIKQAHMEKDAMMQDLQQVTSHILSHQVISQEDLVKSLQSDKDAHLLSLELTKMSKDHYSNIVGNNIKLILNNDHDQPLKIGKHQFDCPIKYLEHEINNPAHAYADIARFKRNIPRLQEHLHQMELAKGMNKDMGGMSM